MISRNDPCWCGSLQKWKKCHYPKLPSNTPQNKRDYYLKQWGILLKTPEQIKGIRESCKLAAKILDTLCKMAVEGVTTNELNTVAEKMSKESGAIAATLGYGDPPYPKSICTSLNEVICHGIPDDKPLKKGDILNIDFTCILNGYYGDCSRMVTIGPVSEERQLVVDVAYECLMRSIAIVKPGAFICDIGEVIEDYATSRKCSVVHQFVGHGVGVDFHEPPQIPFNKNTLRIPFEEGMTFTIEPMINAGVREAVIDHRDGWTARTRDGKASAQWEHTLLVTSSGVEILTNP